MKLSYDPAVDALYIRLIDEPAAHGSLIFEGKSEI